MIDYTDIPDLETKRSFLHFMVFVLLSGLGCAILFFHFGWPQGAAFSVAAFYVLLDFLRPKSIRELGTHLASILLCPDRNLSVYFTIAIFRTGPIQNAGYQ